MELQNETRSIAILEIQNLQAGVSIKSSYTDIKLKLQDIIVTDRNPDAVHSKVCLERFMMKTEGLHENRFRSCQLLVTTLSHASWSYSILTQLLPTTRITCTSRSRWDALKLFSLISSYLPSSISSIIFRQHNKRSRMRVRMFRKPPKRMWSKRIHRQLG